MLSETSNRMCLDLSRQSLIGMPNFLVIHNNSIWKKHFLGLKFVFIHL